jgi:hypothetical protein
MMSDKKSLVPIEQRTVDFYGDEILAVRGQDGEVYVPIRPICDLIGVTWPSQRNRINRDAVLSEEAINISVFVTNTQGEQGQRREMICLPLRYINGFLFGLTVSRVKEEYQERLKLYQRKCYEVLYEAFQEGRLTQEPEFRALLEAESPAAQAYRTFQALMKLARSQVFLEAQLGNHGIRIDGLEKRLELLEDTLGDPDRTISPEQATNISQAVKTIAMFLSKASGRNEYGGIYGEFYRQFKIPTYRELPVSQYDAAMKFFREWYESLTDDEIPF